MAKWRIHFKQWERTQLTPICEFWWVVEADTADLARKTLLEDIDYWSSVNLLNRADHNNKNGPWPSKVPIVWKGVHTQIYEVKRVREQSSN